jgi:hypothetical protein
VDIVVTPSSNPKVHDLMDRLGRRAGIIEHVPPMAYAIRPVPGGPLDGLGRRTVPTLDEAMSVIADYTKGECQLASGEQQE